MNDKSIPSFEGLYPQKNNWTFYSQINSVLIDGFRSLICGNTVQVENYLIFHSCIFLLGNIKYTLVPFPIEKIVKTENYIKSARSL